MTKEETEQYFINLYAEHIKQEDIPEWANWIATDEDGGVWIYKYAPCLDESGYFFADGKDNFGMVKLLTEESQPYWHMSVMNISSLLPHYPSQQKEESMQDKIEFEAVSGDQSLFDLVGAKDDDLFIVRNANLNGIYATKYPVTSSRVLAERKVKEKPYIPEVGHIYKLSKECTNVFSCVFVDNEGDVWSTCDGVMFTHRIGYLSRNSIKFIHVN